MSIAAVNQRVNAYCVQAQWDMLLYKTCHLGLTALSFVSFASAVRNPLSKVTVGKVGFVYLFYRIATHMLLKSEKIKQAYVGKITQEYTNYLAKADPRSIEVAAPAVRATLCLVQWTTGMQWISLISNAYSVANQLSQFIPKNDFKEACEQEAKDLIVSAIAIHAETHLDRLSTVQGFVFGLDFPSIKQIIHARLQADLANRLMKRLSIDNKHKDEVDNIVLAVINSLDDLYQDWEHVAR